VIIKLLKKRFDVSSDIWLYKKELGYNHFDSKRESEIVEKIKLKVDDSILENHIVKIYENILIESKAYQCEKDGEK